MTTKTLSDELAEILSFSVADLSLTEEHDQHGCRQKLRMTLALQKPKDVIMANKGSLAKKQCTALLIGEPSYNEYTSKNGAIGMFCHYQSLCEPDSCVLNITICPAAFSALLRAALQGRKPSSLIVHVAQMTSGPDGIAIWQGESNTQIPIVHLSYEIPLVL